VKFKGVKPFISLLTPRMNVKRYFVRRVSEGLAVQRTAGFSPGEAKQALGAWEETDISKVAA
jgi:hypothetical protein